MAKKSNFLKNLLTTASTLAVLTSGASSAYAGAGAGYSRPIADGARFGNAALEFRSENGGGAAAYVDDRNFVNSLVGAPGGAANLAADTGVSIINSFNMYGNGNATLTFDDAATGSSIGSVYNTVPGLGVGLQLDVAGVNAANANAGATANADATNTTKQSMLKVVLPTGNISIIAGGGGKNGGTAIAPVRVYDNLGEIDFAHKAAVLISNAGGAIVLNNATVTNADNAGSQLTVTTDLTVKHASFATISKFALGAGRNLTFDVGNNNIATTAISDYTFANNVANIRFKVAATGGNNINLGNHLMQVGNVDDRGRVIFENSVAPVVGGNANLLTVTSAAGKTIGGDNAHRFTELRFDGVGDVLLDDKITPFALLIRQAGTGKATITNAADATVLLGDITFGAAGKLEFLGAVTRAAAHVTAGGELILRANSNIAATAVTSGKLTADTAELTGDLLVDANTLAVGGSSASVKKITGDIDVQRGGVVSVVEDVVGAIDAGNAGVSLVNLTGDGNVSGPIGATQKIGKIAVSGNRTFADAAFGDAGATGLIELNFAAADKKVTLQDAGASLLATNVTLNQNGDHVIEVQTGPGNNQVIAGAINAAGRMNTAGNGYGLTIKVMGGVLTGANVTNADFKANLVADQADVVTLTLDGNAAGSVGNLGSENARFVDTIFDQAVANEISVGDIYSKDIHVHAGRKAKFRGKVVSDKVTLDNVDSQAKFADGVHLKSKVVTANAGEGLVEFEGAAIIDETISGIKRTRFTAAAPALGDMPKIVQLNKSIDSATIEGGYALLRADSNVAISGATTAKYVGAQAGKTLIFNGGALTLEGQSVVYSQVTDVAGVVKAGKVSVEDNLLNLDNLDTTQVAINDSGSGAPVEGAKFTVFQNQVGVLNGKNFQGKLLAEVTNLNQDSLALWTATSDQANIYITQRDNTQKTLDKDVKDNGGDATDRANLDVLFADADIKTEIANMNGASRVELAQRLIASDVEAVLSDLTTRIGSDLGARMGTLAGSQGPVQSKVVSAGTTGVSAGDDANRYGAWISPFFNKSAQKSRKGAAGYTATTGGGSFGFDTKANDDMIVGLALSLVHTDVKHKNFKSGDKSKIDSAMFSVYGMQQITDNWFAQGLVTAGSSRVSTNEQRKVTSTTYQKASGKYTSMSFSGEALLGYNYVMDQVSITPMGGVRLTRVNDGGYKETGTTNQNLTISRKALNKAELVLGARVAGGTFDLNGLSVTPEIHGFLNQDVIGKAAKVDMTTKSGGKLLDKSAKPNKTVFNIGAGLNATYNSMEYGAGYDAHLANKFVGHQGTLKVRVNF